MKKILMTIGIILVVLILAMTVGVTIFIGPIIKTGIETIGPKITQVSVKLDAVDVSLLSGRAAIKGLVVGNPEGFTTPEAIKLHRAEITLDPLSVTKPKVVIRAIHVESPEITFDGGPKSNNLNKIMENVNAVAQKAAPAPGQKTTTPAPGTNTQPPAPKIQVDDFLITGAKVHVHLTGLMNKEMTVTIPDIHLTNLGQGTDGITPAELVRVVLNQINLSTIKVVTQTLANSGKMIEGLGKDITKESMGTIKNVTKSLGGLLGK
jgi:hypothetical protein